MGVPRVRVIATVGTLTIGLGMFAVVYTAVQKILIAPMPYRHPDDLYFVWRDFGPIRDQKRAGLAGTDVAELQKASDVVEISRARRRIASIGRRAAPASR